MADDYIKRLGLVELPEGDAAEYNNSVPLQASSAQVGSGRRGEDEAKKHGKRGRPRVDAQDESAVEIRLAQRAYRERKETTIAGLEKRVSFLQGTIVGMTQVLLEFNEKAAEFGLVEGKPGLGQNLHTATQRILELARNSSGEQELQEELPKRKRARRKPSPTARESDSSESGTSGNVRRVSQQPSPDVNEAQQQISNLHAEPKDMLGYQVYGGGPGNGGLDAATTSSGFQQPQASHHGGWNDAATMQMQSYHPPHHHHQHQQQQQRAQMPQAPSHTEQWKEWVDQPLKPVYTYNFQETSFARRLMRYSYEETYHLITDPAPSPAMTARINHVLRYSLCLNNKGLIASSIRNKLLATQHEPLDHWNVPELHIGGAGLHFPRNGTNSNNSGNGSDGDTTTANDDPHQRRRNIGPWSPQLADKKGVPPLDFPFNLARFADVEGVWFDSHDVEQYLRTKGIYLDGQSSTAVVEVIDDDDAPVPVPVPPLVHDVPYDSPRTSSVDSLGTPQSPLPTTTNNGNGNGNGNDQSMGLFMLSSASSAAGGVDDVLSTGPPYMGRDGCMEDLASSIGGGNSNSNSNTNLAMLPLQQDGRCSNKADYDAPFDYMSLNNNGFPATTTAATTTTSFEPRKKQVVIDVDRLLEVLNKDSICLGRAPGYRMEHVESAIKTVLQESW